MAVGETKVTGLLEGQDVLDTAKGCQTPDIEVIFDITNHPTPHTTLEKAKNITSPPKTTPNLFNFKSLFFFFFLSLTTHHPPSITNIPVKDSIFPLNIKCIFTSKSSSKNSPIIASIIHLGPCFHCVIV